MPSESLREILYPLGFLSGLFFGGRLLLQWILSEMHRESIVPRSFWILTILGNLFAFIHSLIQVQYHVCLIATCNGILGWRNLNLMQPPSKRTSLTTAINLLFGGMLFTTFLFWFQGGDTWFRIPVHNLLQGTPQEISYFWHYLGFLGVALFSSRFWIQWILSEIEGKSVLSAPFWWLSLLGGYLSMAYFVHIHDVVNGIGPLLGTIPYLRNLMLMRKKAFKTS